jgi:hypothetical protein
MFFEGCSIREDVLRRDLLAPYNALRDLLLDESRKYRLANERRRHPGRPTRLEIAEGAALAFLAAKRATLRPLLARMSVLSLQNQAGEGFDVPAENPESLLASALAHFFCVFLYGGAVRSGWEVIPELLHMVGVDQFVRTVLTIFGMSVDDDMYSTLALVLPALSLPALEKTVTEATSDELHAMRDELQATLADFSALGEMLPIVFGERGGRLVPQGRSQDDLSVRVFLLPAVHNVRRLAATQGASPTLRELQRQVPVVRAAIGTLNSPAAQGIDRVELRQEVKRRATEGVRSDRNPRH